MQSQLPSLYSPLGTAYSVNTPYWRHGEGRNFCRNLPQSTLYSYIEYMGVCMLYFQSNFAENSNKQTNKQNQSEAESSLFFLSEVTIVSFRRQNTCRVEGPSRVSALGTSCQGCWVQATEGSASLCQRLQSQVELYITWHHI